MPEQSSNRAPLPKWFIREAVAAHKLTPIEAMVFVVIWDHADATRISWPSQELIAEESGASRSGVKRALARLIATGLIFVATGTEGGGRGRATRYEIPVRMPRPGSVRFLPAPTLRARNTGGGWVAEGS